MTATDDGRPGPDSGASLPAPSESRAGDAPPGPSYIPPNWVQNVALSFACIATAGAVYRMGDEVIPSAGLLALFLAIGAFAFLAAHLPGASGIWLNEEGFELRETYNVTRVRWENMVTRFQVRRRMMGPAVAFQALFEERGRYERHYLPRGVGKSPWKNEAIMNAWLDRYGPRFDFDEDQDMGGTPDGGEDRDDDRDAGDTRTAAGEPDRGPRTG